MSTQNDPSTTGGEGRGPGRLYHIVMLADFGADEQFDRLTPVDKDDLPAVLAKASPSVAVAVKNPGGGAEWEARLALSSFRAFEPAGFLGQIPEARWRLSVREKIVARLGGSASAEELRAVVDAAVVGDASLAWLKQAGGGGTAAQASTASIAQAGGGSILDSIEVASPEAGVAADVARLAASAASPGSGLSGDERTRLGSLLSRLERELSGAADAVLKNPEFRRLETAWRGLKFLVERIDFREGVRLYVVSSTRDLALERFIEQVVEPAFNGDVPTPGLVVVDFPVENLPPHFEFLDTLAQHAASLPVSVTFPVDANFFGVKSLRLIRNLPNLKTTFDGFQFAKWKSLRDKPHARTLTPAVGRFLLRGPYSPDKEHGREFRCAETAAAITDLVWGGGHLALAVSAARSHARNGWPTRMFGSEAGKIDNLPVVDNPNDRNQPWGPGDLVLAQERVEELPEIGMNLLLSAPGKDFCILLGGVSAARPVKTAEISAQTAALQISLPYQLFSNIASSFVCELLPSLSGQPAGEVQQRLERALNDLMAISAEQRVVAEGGDPADLAVVVAASPSPDEPGRTAVQVRLQPPMAIVPGGLAVDFGLLI